MPMKSLKRTPREREVEEREKELKDEYPWGLRVSFDEEVLADLGMTSGDFTVGEVFETKVRFKVESQSEYASDEHESSSVGLVITAVETQGDATSQAKKMFGGEDE